MVREWQGWSQRGKEEARLVLAFRAGTCPGVFLVPPSGLGAPALVFPHPNPLAGQRPSFRKTSVVAKQSSDLSGVTSVCPPWDDATNCETKRYTHSDVLLKRTFLARFLGDVSYKPESCVSSGKSASQKGRIMWLLSVLWRRQECLKCVRGESHLRHGVPEERTGDLAAWAVTGAPRRLCCLISLSCVAVASHAAFPFCGVSAETGAHTDNGIRIEAWGLGCMK
nr:uncharacterized protein LOC105855665 [Microcebus murinus]